jgi:tetratricopeptide (TPR) repeat protein
MTSPESTTPASLSEALESLLGGGISPTEQSRRLFAASIAQVRERDPELADVMPALALLRRFDAGIIGELRGALNNSEGNQRMLDALRQLAFVEAAGESLRYHDSVREALLEEWQRDERRAEYDALREKLGRGFLERGKQLLIAGEIQEARDDLVDAQQLWHENPYTYLWLGAANIAAQNYEAAVYLLDQATRTIPHRDSYFWRGVAEYKANNNYISIESFNSAIDHCDDEGLLIYWEGHIPRIAQSNQAVIADILNWRGVQLVESNDYPAALADFSRAIDLQPDNGDNYFWRGHVHYAQRNYAAALADLSRAVDLQIRQGDNYFWRGRAYHAHGDHAAAVADFSHAIALQPDDGDNYFWRGRVYHAQGNYPAVLADFSRAVDLQPGKGSYYFWRGRVYHAQGNYPAALADFSRAVDLQPGKGSYYFWRGRAYQTQENFVAALTDFSRAVDLQPDQNSNYLWRGLIWLEKGQFLSAQADFDRAIAVDVNYLHARFWRGVTLLREGVNDRAQEDIAAEAINATEPKQSRRLRLAAKLAALRGDISETQVIYRDALNICSPPDLHTELLYLRILARVFPERADLAELHGWFMAQVEELRERE